MKKRYHIKYYHVKRFDIMDTHTTGFFMENTKVATCHSKGYAHLVADALNKSVAIHSTSSNKQMPKSLCDSCVSNCILEDLELGNEFEVSRCPKYRP